MLLFGFMSCSLEVFKILYIHVGVFFVVVCAHVQICLKTFKIHFCCRNDDREILLECQRKGPSSKTFVSLATRLNKSPNQVGITILLLDNNYIDIFMIAVEQRPLEIFVNLELFFPHVFCWGILEKSISDSPRCRFLKIHINRVLWSWDSSVSV